jgi:hypothetical protein
LQWELYTSLEDEENKTNIPFFSIFEFADRILGKTIRKQSVQWSFSAIILCFDSFMCSCKYGISLNFKKGYHKKSSIIEGIKPSVTGIGSPGTRNIRIVSPSVMKEPIKIRSKDRLPAKIPKFSKVFATTIA